MRSLATAALMVAALTSSPAFAENERGYVSASTGFAAAPDATSAAFAGEAGFRVARHVQLFGNLGRLNNLDPSMVQPAIDATELMLSANDIDVSGAARVPAWYGQGGVRVEFGSRSHIVPYVTGAGGMARLEPEASFTFKGGSGLDPSGVMPVPSPGDDVTDEIASIGAFTLPPATSAFMFSLGGGAGFPVSKKVRFDAGYRFSRVATDSAVHAQGLTFGVGYRF